jgi:hypothetical protein
MSYDKLMKDLSEMSEEDKQAKMKELDNDCICGMCPSYMGTGEDKLTFCVIGKSSKISEENGCVCPGCPVQTNYGLKWQYYCTKGSGKDLEGT